MILFLQTNSKYGLTNTSHRQLNHRHKNQIDIFLLAQILDLVVPNTLYHQKYRGL